MERHVGAQMEEGQLVPKASKGQKVKSAAAILGSKGGKALTG